MLQINIIDSRILYLYLPNLSRLLYLLKHLITLLYRSHTEGWSRFFYKRTSFMCFYWILHYTFHFHEWKFCIHLLILLCLQVMSVALLCSSFHFLLNAAPLLTNTMIPFCCLFASQPTICPQPMDEIAHVLDHVSHLSFIHKNTLHCCLQTTTWCVPASIHPT